MGLIGKLISAFIRTERNGAKVNDVQVSVGAGRVLTVGVFQPSGEDSNPIESDYPILMKMPGTNRYAIVGYVDSINSGESAAGEKRFYARSADGTITGSLWLKADGTHTFNSGTNHAVQYEALKSAFDELRSELNTFIGVFNNHTHLYAPGPGSPTASAIPATPGTDAAADMSPSEIPNILVP